MKHLFLFIIVVIAASCAKEPKQEVKEPEEPPAVSAQTANHIYRMDGDKRGYSEEFLYNLANHKSTQKIIVKDNYILVDSDTVHFPEDLVKMKDYHFTGFTEKRFYQLDVRRTNLTSLDYEYAVFENEKPIHKAKGTVHLNAGFYLGSETADDDETGDGYLLTEYMSMGKDSYSIRIGEPDEQGRLRAVVTGGKPNDAVNPDITLRQSM